MTHTNVHIYSPVCVTGSLLGWGRGQSQPASMHPISALLAQQSNLFVLTTGALQRWHGSTLVFEFPLQTAVENWLRDETLTDAMDATEAQVSYRVWLLRMVPGVPGETVHVLVARFVIVDLTLMLCACCVCRTNCVCMFCSLSSVVC